MRGDGGPTARGRGALPRPKEAMSRPMPPGGTYAGGGTPGTVRARGVWNDLWTGYLQGLRTSFLCRSTHV